MSIDLSSFSKTKVNENDSNEEKDTPKWVTSGTTTVKKLYYEICKQKEKIQEAIVEQGDKLGINDRRIIANRIAKVCGIDRSFLTKRRVPQLVILIEQFNEDLEIAWQRRSKRSSGLRRLNRKEIEAELIALRKDNERLVNEGLKRDLQSAVEALGVERRLELVSELDNMKKLLIEKNETISNLKSQLRKFTIYSVDRTD